MDSLSGLTNMLDSLFRRGNPTNNWTRDAKLAIAVELLWPCTINSVTVGSHIEELSFLGRSSSKQKSPLDFYEIGLSVDHEDDGSFSGFQTVFEDSSNTSGVFCGSLLIDGAVVECARLADTLGVPYWIDRDEEEQILFFEYANHEIQIEQTLNGINKRLILTTQPLMASPEQRQAYRVDKPWPPK